MLFRMTEEDETRRLTLIGIVLVLCLAVVCGLALFNSSNDRKADKISVTMELPYVGQGITSGSPLMMHGVTVGKVTAVTSMSSGGVRLNADLASEPTANLTDALSVDFRPANYFGVTAINLIGGQGGQRLSDGMQITTQPTGNFTLQALLTQMGDITKSVVTPQLVDVISRATRYTDGLNPLIESMIIAAQAVTDVQTVSTEQLLRNATGISVVFPGVIDAATMMGYHMNQKSSLMKFEINGDGSLPQEYNPVVGEPVSEDFWQDRYLAFLDIVANSLFGAVGNVLSSHTSDLLPVVNMVKSLTDTVPGLISPVGMNDTLVELRSRFETLYAGSPEQRALQVHIVLDKVPGIQAPIDAMGGP